jgi:hypothetical protein
MRSKEDSMGPSIFYWSVVANPTPHRPYRMNSPDLTDPLI